MVLKITILLNLWSYTLYSEHSWIRTNSFWIVEFICFKNAQTRRFLFLVVSFLWSIHVYGPKISDDHQLYFLKCNQLFYFSFLNTTSNCKYVSCIVTYRYLHSKDIEKFSKTRFLRSFWYWAEHSIVFFCFNLICCSVFK